jgi:hypothetical protein
MEIMADESLTRDEFVRYMEGFENRMMMRFEELHGTVRLSFEAIEALRETTDRGFAEMRRDHKEQTDLLQAAIKHIRVRVETLERHD